MSRQIFGKPPTEAAEDEILPSQVERRTQKKPLMGLENLGGPRKEGQPVGAFGASLSAISERGRHAEEIEKKLAAGETVVDLDTALIEPSFVSDRMPLTQEALADLVEAIRESTQLSPILVRPHPDYPGRYQTAFGHRRVRAVAVLGRPVRAIVRQLTDEEMVVAQGQENNARKDLSYIEKALFAQRLERRNFPRSTIMAALSIYKSDLSNMLAVAHRVPLALIEAIGPAPTTGRRGWIELAELLKSAELIEIAQRAAGAPLTQAQNSDERFNVVLAAVKPGRITSSSDVLKNNSGGRIGKVVSNANRLVLTIDRKQAGKFADYLLDRLPALCAEFAENVRE